MATQLAAEERRRLEAEEQARFAETFVGHAGPRSAQSAERDHDDDQAAAPDGDRAQRARPPSSACMSSAQRMSSMVAQLLDLTRSRIAGGITRRQGARRPRRRGVRGGRRAEARLSGPRDRWTGGAGLHANADRDRLAQVFSNLIGNALEHGDPARPVTVDLIVATTSRSRSTTTGRRSRPSSAAPVRAVPPHGGRAASGRGASAWACSSRSRSSARTAARSRSRRRSSREPPSRVTAAPRRRRQIVAPAPQQLVS